MYQSERGKRITPPRENWPWDEKVSKTNTQIKLFSEEYHGVKCSLPSPQTLLFRADHAARASRVTWSKCLGYVTEVSDREGLGKRRTRTRQNSKHADAWTAPFKSHRYVFGNAKCTVCIWGEGSQTHFLDSTKSSPTVCERFPLFLFHLFRSFILPLPHNTHSHFTMNLQYLNDFRL